MVADYQCKGSWALGSACGFCTRCLTELMNVPKARMKVLMQAHYERKHAESHDDRTAAYDDALVNGQLRDAAVVQLFQDNDPSNAEDEMRIRFWPFKAYPKDKGYRQNLIRGIQFLLAEIERLDRVKPSSK